MYNGFEQEGDGIGLTYNGEPAMQAMNYEKPFSIRVGENRCIATYMSPDGIYYADDTETAIRYIIERNLEEGSTAHWLITGKLELEA